MRLTTVHFLPRYSLFDIRYSLLLLFSLASMPLCTAQEPVNHVNASLANAFARLIEQSIPRTYEKRKDWGKTKNITVGVRNKGIKLYRRKKPVKHGTWKHYKLSLIEPEKKLAVRIENLHAAKDGRIGFTLEIQSQFDLWARAKVYQYGVQLIALEIVGDAAIDLQLECEVGMKFQTQDGSVGMALDPLVVDARLDITALHLDRISNAKGPLVREFGEELPRWIEHELSGPHLVAKLNKAIDKKRDRLELSVSDLLTGK